MNLPTQVSRPSRGRFLDSMHMSIRAGRGSRGQNKRCQSGDLLTPELFCDWSVWPHNRHLGQSKRTEIRWQSSTEPPSLCHGLTARGHPGAPHPDLSTIQLLVRLLLIYGV